MMSSQVHIRGTNRYMWKVVRYGWGITWGAEQEGTVEIQDKELACRLRERVGGRQHEFEVGR